MAQHLTKKMSYIDSIRTGNFTIFDQIVREYDAPLKSAVCNGDESMVHKDGQSHAGQLEVMEEAIYGGHLKMVKMLIEEYGSTAHHKVSMTEAIILGYEDIILYLIGQGCVITANDLRAAKTKGMDRVVAAASTLMRCE